MVFENSVNPVGAFSDLVSARAVKVLYLDHAKAASDIKIKKRRHIDQQKEGIGQAWGNLLSLQ